MPFIPVACYSATDGNFLGYAIKAAEVPSKLQSTNLYLEGEEVKLNEQLAALNENVDIRSHWPSHNDPEVQALVNDPSFMPIEYIDAQVVDDDHSLYVWKKEHATDDHGNPLFDLATGQPVMVDGSELDEMASVISYKIARVPKRPSDAMWRIKKAAETIARRRAGV